MWSLGVTHDVTGSLRWPLIHGDHEITVGVFEGAGRVALDSLWADVKTRTTERPLLGR